jgi:hypothetical protein
MTEQKKSEGFDWVSTLKFAIPLTLGLVISVYSVRMSMELQLNDLKHVAEANQKHLDRLRVEMEAALVDLRRDLRTHTNSGLGGMPHPHIFTIKIKEIGSRLDRHRIRLDKIQKRH